LVGLKSVEVYPSALGLLETPVKVSHNLDIGFYLS
jgi:hypothetical protein